MQVSAILNHVTSLVSPALQLLLIAFTVWFLPTRLTTKPLGLLIFILAVPLLWVAYSGLALLVDGLIGNDVPGIGYLLLGFVSGVIGLFVYVRRRSREKNV